MKKEEIKKAYSLCASANNCNNCGDCPDCADCASKAALDLIYEQEEKIKQQDGEIERLERVINDQNELCWSCNQGGKDNYDRGFSDGQSISRKETAREILQYLYEKIGNAPLSDIELVNYLAKQYGVNLEE